MQNFIFIKEKHTHTENELSILVSKEISSKENLFTALANKLSFPKYFGYNWDALEECLKDFHWIKENSIFIEHEDLPDISKKYLKIYLSILIEALRFWENKKEHSLKISFPQSYANQIINIINQ